MDCLNNFIFRDEDRIVEKIKHFLDSGKEKIHLVLDFDRTLTESQNKLGENVSTWEILKTHLPQNSQEGYQALYNKYRPLELKNVMSLSDAVTWWEGILNLYKMNKLRCSDIANDIETRIPIRACVKELFKICEEKNIPIIIISAGIKDVIEMWCQKFSIKPSIILSTKLIFDSKGYIKGWDRSSLIHVLNKKEKGHKQIGKMRESRPNTILVGDSVSDARMVSGDENVLRIIVDDPRTDDELDEEFYKDMFSKFDLVIRNKSLCPVIDIVKLF